MQQRGLGSVSLPGDNGCGCPQTNVSTGNGESGIHAPTTAQTHVGAEPYLSNDLLDGGIAPPAPGFGEFRFVALLMIDKTGATEIHRVRHTNTHMHSFPYLTFSRLVFLALYLSYCQE